MNQDPVGEAFVNALRYALLNLYDPARLRNSPLLALFDLEGKHNPISGLRQLLIAAVHALRPSDDVPLQSNAWRFYQVLTYRYLEQTNARMVASNLGLSERQLRRSERDAEEQLADYLWTHYSLEGKASILLDSTATDDNPAPASAEMPGRKQELEWMHESFPSETAQMAELIPPVVKIAAPLLQAAGIQVRYELEPDLPPVTGQLSAVRQALLNLLIAAARVVPGGQVQLSVHAAPEGLRVCIEGSYGQDAAPPRPDIHDELEMARQFAELFRGKLQVTQEAERPLVATLSLPLSDKVPILVIDDNADTLRLLQRYLDGSRYHFVGLRDPDEALEAVQQCRPQIIVLDVMLPGIEDWEMLGRLREHPATRNIPILICTILPQEELALTLGAADFIRKPVSRQDFLAALDRQAEQLLPKSP
jgi:CheY-like chemotaxis protein